MEWFKKAAEQGHPHSAYNLAIGHLNGLQTGLQPGKEDTVSWINIHWFMELSISFNAYKKKPTFIIGV